MTTTKQIGQTTKRKIDRGHIDQYCRKEIVKDNLTRALEYIRNASTEINMVDNPKFIEVQVIVSDWIDELEKQQHDLMNQIDKALKGVHQ